jgi:2',3'-cyclic-nucleotide 2'-phosphodiesterase (5'-nucleotidase family)
LGEGGPLLAQPSLLLDVGGRSLGIIGVSTPEDTELSQLEQGEVGAHEPVSAVREQVGALASQTDIIIVLSDLGLEADQQLAEQVEGVDLIVGGRSREKLAEPVRYGASGTLITQAGDRGEWLGILDLEFDQQGRVVSYEGRGHDLDESIPEDDGMISWLQSVRPTATPAAEPVN